MLPNDETRPAFSSGSIRPLWIFLPFAAAYFLSYLFRTVNGSIASSLVTAFDLDARQLGLLTASYFFTFAVCQLPLGAALTASARAAFRPCCSASRRRARSCSRSRTGPRS